MRATIREDDLSQDDLSRSSSSLHSTSSTDLTMSIDAKSLDDSPLETGHHTSQLVVSEQQSRKERLSAAFTIACSGFALISDGLQNK